MTDDTMPTLANLESGLSAARARHDDLTFRRLMAKTIGQLKARGEHDPARLPEGQYPPLTVAEHLEILATGALAARYYRHPADVHDAVTAGAAWPQIAAATGTSEAEARAAYRRWADGQHELGGKFGMSDADYAAAIERAGLPAPRTLTIELTGSDDSFALTGALREWAAGLRRETAGDPGSAGGRHRQADAAGRLLECIEATLEGRS